MNLANGKGSTPDDERVVFRLGKRAGKKYESDRSYFGNALKGLPGPIGQSVMLFNISAEGQIKLFPNQRRRRTTLGTRTRAGYRRGRLRSPFTQSVTEGTDAAATFDTARTAQSSCPTYGWRSSTKRHAMEMLKGGNASDSRSAQVRHFGSAFCNSSHDGGHVWIGASINIFKVRAGRSIKLVNGRVSPSNLYDRKADKQN